MTNLSLILAIFTALTSLCAAVASVIGATQKKKLENLSLDFDSTKQKFQVSQKELYNVYRNLNEFLEIEKDLSAELDVNKRTTRKGRLTDRYAQPKHVQKRIIELEKELQIK